MLGVVLLLSGCSEAPEQQRLRLATTTSTENSGLLSVLLPPFEKANNVKVDVIAVGTGKALKLGENGDVDVVLVHSRKAEDEFMSGGYGVLRKDVMHNDFVIVGPEDDPAGLSEIDNAVEAFRKLEEGNVAFVSRGDDSGTHKKEMEIWSNTLISPLGDWYIETGQGMGAVLRIAEEKGAYALTDRGTYLAYSDKVDLRIIVSGDPFLFNPYGVMAVNPERHDGIKKELALKLISYITGAEGQSVIANYRVNGQQLFFPDAVASE